MKHQNRSWWLALGVAIALGFASQTEAETTALDDYVAAPDPNYSYTRVGSRVREGYTVFVFSMTSQEWRAPEEVDRVLWNHELLISVPWIRRSGNQNTAFLIVSGGSNTAASTTGNDDLVGLLSVVTGAVTAMVSQIPNQPLHFADEDQGNRINIL